jgi:hypothetical protein
MRHLFAFALAIASCLPVPAYAGEVAPPSTVAHALAPAPAPAPLVPTVPSPDELARAQQAIKVLDGGLHQLQAMLGIPAPTALPPAFYDSTAGKVIVWGGFALGVGTTIAGIVLGSIEAARAH